MNRIHTKISLLALLLVSVALLQGCADKTVRIYEANVPVYQSLQEFRATVPSFEAPRQLHRPGKIYIYGQYLLVNEMMEGIHFFDNSNPSSPINLGFLPVLANMDLAVNDHVLYVDNYYDLLAFDITDPRAPRLTARVNDVFRFNQYGLFPSYNAGYPALGVDESQGIVISWKIEKTTEDVNTNYYWAYNSTMIDFASPMTGAEANIGGAGIGGSTARFTVWDNFLYTLEPNELGVFSLNGTPVHLRDIQLNRNSETLFPAEGRLFIGTTTGMMIYSLQDGANPQFISDYNHFLSCDPVVVQGDKAFVTLSTGRTCGGNVNSLEVIDLSNIVSPTLLYSYDMTNPRGLGVDGDLLFLCDGPDGLKVFDKSDLSAIPANQISIFPNIESADVIPYNGTLIMTSAEGIFQYDYTDPANIVQLSQILVTP
jgi:hypothetical protein